MINICVRVNNIVTEMEPIVIFSITSITEKVLSIQQVFVINLFSDFIDLDNTSILN